MRKMCFLLSCLLVVASPALGQCGLDHDVTGDGIFNQDDPKFLLVYLFDNGAAPVCPGEADANGDGKVTIADPIFMLTLLNNAACSAARLGDVDGNGIITLVDVNYLLNHLFLSGPAPVPCADVGDANQNGSLSIADAVTISNNLDCPGIPGDVNSDELVNEEDAKLILDYLFLGGAAPFPCNDAADYNQDGSVNIADPIGILSGSSSCP
ncbi:MAG: dockerin type I domain-containing protein [Acidobacteriota bacterium]